MAIEKFYLTAAGETLLAKAQVGQNLNFSKMQVGQGSLPDGTDITGLQGLIDPVKDIPITGKQISNKTARVKGFFNNQGISTPFYWREVGLFADDPELGMVLYGYGYAATSADRIPTYSISPTEFTFVLVTQVGNAVNVTATIDESLIFVPASRKINGKSLSADFSLTVEDLNIPQADAMNYGLVRLSEDFKLSSEGNLELAKTYTTQDDFASHVDSSAHITSVEREEWNGKANQTNKNLLHNWDFRHPVNTGGQTSYTGHDIYTIDRWKVGVSTIPMTVSIGSGYIGIKEQDFFSQAIEGKSLYGKTLTLSVMLYDGSIIAGSGVLPIESTAWQYIEIGGTSEIGLALQNYNGTDFNIAVMNKTSTEKKLVAVKLEFGVVSTLVNDPPADYNEQLLLCQSFTNDGKYVRGFGSNENLLHNWDFRNPVNQKGQSSYSGSYTYSIDRWVINNATLDVANGTLTSTGSDAKIYQVIEVYEIPSIHTPITFSAVVNGELCVLHGTIYDNTVKVFDWGNLIFGVGGNENYYVQISLSDSVQITIQCMKLELGSVSTLANDPPADYGEQLAICQRYLMVIKKFDFFLAHVENPDYLDFMLPSPTPLRTTPIIVNPAFKITTGNAVVTDATIRIATEGNDLNQVRARATKNSHGISDLAVIEATDNVFLDANL